MTRKHPESGPLALKEGLRVPDSPASRGPVWECHLLTADTSDGQTFEIVPIVDERTDECLATLVERNISVQDVTDCLFDLFVLRGPPERIRSDNGAGSLAKSIDDWLHQTGVETRSVKGGPSGDGGGGLLAAKLRDDLIGKTTFATLPEAKAAIAGWCRLHNETLRRDAAHDREATQSPLPGRSGSGVSDGVEPERRHAPVGQVEEEQAAGLPKSPGRGFEARQSIPGAPDSLSGKVDKGVSVLPESSSVGRVEEEQAAGLPKSPGRGFEARQSIPGAPDSLSGNVASGQSVPRKDVSVGGGEEEQSAGLPESPARGFEARQPVPGTPDSLFGEADSGQSAPQLGSAVGKVEAGPASSPSAGSEARLIVLTDESPSLMVGGGSFPEKEPGIGRIEVTLFQVKLLVRSPRQGRVRRSKLGRLPRWPSLYAANLTARVSSRIGGFRRRRKVQRKQHDLPDSAGQQAPQNEKSLP